VQECLLDDTAAAPADTEAQVEKKIGGDGGDPQPADLDQSQDHQLAKAGQPAAGIDDDQAGGALGRVGGEERIEKEGGRPMGGYGQREQPGSQ
jgi:hypothetical protein